MPPREPSVPAPGLETLFGPPRAPSVAREFEPLAAAQAPAILLPEASTRARIEANRIAKEGL